MWQDAHDSYLESRVLSADPIELVRMLYQSATRAVENARRHLAAGDIAARARSISHASSVLIELTTSLDHDRGGSISTNLARLYDYMLRRLTEANLQQNDAPLAEVLGLLSTLSDGWENVQTPGARIPAPQPAASEERTWTQLGGADSSTHSEYSWTGYGSSPEPVKPQEPDDVATGTSWDQDNFLPPPNPAAAAEPDAPAPWAPAPDSWQPAQSAWEPIAAYGNSWAHLAAQEAATCSHHDWSL